MDTLASPAFALLQFSLIAGLVLTACVWGVYFWLRHTGRLPRKQADPTLPPAIESADRVRLAQCAQHLGISETRALKRAIAQFHTALFAASRPGDHPHPPPAAPRQTHDTPRHG